MINKVSNFIFVICFFSTQAFAGFTDEKPTTTTSETNNQLVGVSNNALQSQKDSKSTNIAGLILAAAMFAICPTSPAACAIGAMSLADALMASKNRSNSGVTNNFVGGNKEGTPPGDSTADGGLSPEQLAQAEDLKNKFASQGYVADPNTGSVTFPGGAQVPASSLASPAALEAAGFDPTSAKNFADQFNALKADAEKSLVKGSDDDASGAKGSGAGNAEGDIGSTLLSQAGIKKVEKAGVDSGRDISSLNKKYGDDLIGVSAADIFLIVNKKYQAETNNGSFY